MNRAERLAPAIRSQAADVRSGGARRRSSMLKRRYTTAASVAAAQAALDAAMGEYPGTIRPWVGCTEEELHEAVQAALNDYYL